MAKTVYMVNLGCPKNLVDGEVMLGLLAREGYQISLDPERAVETDEVGHRTHDATTYAGGLTFPPPAR